MARRLGILIRQLVGNGNNLNPNPNPCGRARAVATAAGHLLLHHHRKQFVCNSNCIQIRTLTRTPSSSIPSTTPSISPRHPRADTNTNTDAFSFTPFAPPNGFRLATHEGHREALQKVHDERIPAVFFYAPPWSILRPIPERNPLYHDLCREFPHITLFLVYVDPYGSGMKLRKLGVYQRPAFHIYLEGEKVAEIDSDSIPCLKRTLENINNPSELEKMRAQAKKDKNDGEDLSQLVEVLAGRFPASSMPKVMEAIESLPEGWGEADGDLWWFAQGLFSSQEKREEFASIEDPDLKLQWINREWAEE